MRQDKIKNSGCGHGNKDRRKGRKEKGKEI